MIVTRTNISHNIIESKEIYVSFEIIYSVEEDH